MQISCLTITQPGRLPLLRQCLADFAAQTYAERELVVVHDGDAAFDRNVRQLADTFRHPGISIHAATAGTSLGALRNHAVAQARGALVCQWDDDDRYHPQRLALQCAALTAAGADFCFLQDQLHWFAPTGELYWDDWNREPYPLNFVQGTLMGRREKMPRYPDLPRGEDTDLCLQILRQGHRVTRLAGQGWCYVYVFHGGNVFAHRHHAAISRTKQLGAAQMLGREALLRQRLREYAPALPQARYQATGVSLDFSAASEGAASTTGSRSIE